MNTRASSAADKTDNVTPEAAPRIDATAQPLLLRLEHSIRFSNDDLEQLQPVFGASVVVRHDLPSDEAAKTVWLSAAAWQGLATIIRQTPNWHRNNVATFFEVLHFVMPMDSALSDLLTEAIREIRADPYGAVSETDRDDHDFIWA